MYERKTTKKTTNDHAAWKPEDDRMLLDLVKRRVPTIDIASVLGRTKRAIKQRLVTIHRDAWLASGHPELASESFPHLAAGGATKAPGETMRRLEQKVDRLTAMLSLFMTEVLGEQQATPDQDAKPNGRAHG